MLTKALLTLITVISMVLGGVSDPSITGKSVAKPALSQNQPAEFTVEFFPVAPYHVGDLISIRVTYRGSAEIGDSEIVLALAGEPSLILEKTTFLRFSKQAYFYWVLDTSQYSPGYIDFHFEVIGTDDTWTEGINLLPRPENRQFEWTSVQSSCCTIHYLTGTDAAEDIAEVKQILEARTDEALSQFFPQEVTTDALPEALADPLELVLIPIVIGHGGFATDIAVMAYSDRNWAGIDLGILSHHEIVHVLDRHLNPGPRPSILSEGLAVYLAGGHYRPGDPLERAAALLELGFYLPIVEITDDFYAAQHEIGYMEAAALVAYLEEIWGWEALIDFYFSLEEGENDSSEISSALQNRFGMDLAALEADFIDYLGNINPDQQVIDDVRLTVETYDMIRRYQRLLIPSAHFQSAWWPPIDQVIDDEIVGDYALREKAPLNIIIENLFLEIHSRFDAGDYQRVEENLQRIDQVLNAVEASGGSISHYAIGWPLPKIGGNPLRP